MIEEALYKKKHTQFKTRVKKTWPFYDLNGQNRNPIYDQPIQGGSVAALVSL